LLPCPRQEREGEAGGTGTWGVGAGSGGSHETPRLVHFIPVAYTAIPSHRQGPRGTAKGRR
jgi:hypothetical protein